MAAFLFEQMRMTGMRIWIGQTGMVLAVFLFVYFMTGVEFLFFTPRRFAFLSWYFWDFSVFISNSLFIQGKKIWNVGNRSYCQIFYWKVASDQNLHSQRRGFAYACWYCVADFQKLKPYGMADDFLSVSAIFAGIQWRDLFVEESYFCAFSKMGLWHVHVPVRHFRRRYFCLSRNFIR